MVSPSLRRAGSRPLDELYGVYRYVQLGTDEEACVVLLLFLERSILYMGYAVFASASSANMSSTSS
jgi:hypothetical protein